MGKILKQAENALEIHARVSARFGPVLLAAGLHVTPVFKQVESGLLRPLHGHGDCFFRRKTVHALDGQLDVVVGSPRERVAHHPPAGRCSVTEIPVVGKGRNAVGRHNRLEFDVVTGIGGCWSLQGDRRRRRRN